MPLNHCDSVSETLDYIMRLPDLNPHALYTRVLEIATRDQLPNREELEPFQSFAFNPLLYPFIMNPFLSEHVREALTNSVNWLLEVGGQDVMVEINQIRSHGALTPTFEVRVIVLDNPTSENSSDGRYPHEHR